MKGILKETERGRNAVFKTELEYGRYDDGIYFNFDCDGSKLYSAYDEDNAELYRGDVCEVFIRVGENKRKYYEIEVAPNGKAFFSKIHYFSGRPKGTFLPITFERKVIEKDGGYKVEIKIPYSTINLKKGENFYFNAFRIETEGGTEEKNLYALSPTFALKFHRPKAFIPFE